MATIIDSSDEEHVATLVHPDEYAKNVNQVASVSTHKIKFVKRKELAMTPYELLTFPISDCTSIAYEKRYAVVPMTVGALFVLLVLFILTSEVPVGTRVPIGALAVLVVAGAGWVFRPKRHRLTFVVRGKPLRWQSKAGDFKYKEISTQKVVAFAKDRGLLSSSES